MSRNRFKVLSILILLFIGFHACRNSPDPAGERLYAEKCANCHGDEGQGLRRVIPPLAKADYLADHQEDLPCIIRYGMKGEITVNGVSFSYPMGANLELTDVEITNIINYINRSWGNDLERVSPNQVTEILVNCAQKSTD